MMFTVCNGKPSKGDKLNVKKKFCIAAVTKNEVDLWIDIERAAVIGCWIAKSRFAGREWFCKKQKFNLNLYCFSYLLMRLI